MTGAAGPPQPQPDGMAWLNAHTRATVTATAAAMRQALADVAAASPVDDLGRPTRDLPAPWTLTTPGRAAPSEVPPAAQPLAPVGRDEVSTATRLTTDPTFARAVLNDQRASYLTRRAASAALSAAGPSQTDGTSQHTGEPSAALEDAASPTDGGRDGDAHPTGLGLDGPTRTAVPVRRLAAGRISPRLPDGTRAHVVRYADSLDDVRSRAFRTGPDLPNHQWPRPRP